MKKNGAMTTQRDRRFSISDSGVRVVSNAGGINPYSCAEAVKSVAAKSGVDVKVAVVDGDNLMHLVCTLFFLC